MLAVLSTDQNLYIMNSDTFYFTVNATRTAKTVTCVICVLLVPNSIPGFIPAILKLFRPSIFGIYEEIYIYIDCIFFHFSVYSCCYAPILNIHCVESCQCPTEFRYLTAVLCQQQSLYGTMGISVREWEYKCVSFTVIIKMQILSLEQYLSVNSFLYFKALFITFFSFNFG